MSNASRVTIVLDDGNMKYLRKKQAKRIEGGKSCSFSKILNEELGHSKK